MTTNDATADAGLDLSTTSARAAGDCRSARAVLGGIPSARRKLARKKTADGKGADKGASRPRHRRTGRGFHTHKKGRREHAKLPLHAPQPRVWLASSSAHRERATHRTTRRPYDGIRFVGREVTSLRADDQGGRANPPTIVELPWAPRAQEGRQQLTRHRVAKFAAAQPAENGSGKHGSEPFPVCSGRLLGPIGRCWCWGAALAAGV